ncbi:MAG: helix-turn-helix domain-containing protein [Chloroflexota bacterium]
MIDDAAIKQQFGRRVKELRAARGWSQERLAEESSLHRTYVAQVEVGLRNLSLVSIVRLARALHVPAAAIFGLIDQDNGNPLGRPPP